MSAIGDLFKALKPLKMPIEQGGVYDGTEKKWIVINEVSDTGAIFGDDDSLCNRVIVRANLFLPISENYTQLKKEIRKRIKEAGFTHAQVTMLTEDDTKMRHLVFECEKEESEDL